MVSRSDKACRAIRAAKKESEVIEAVRGYVESLAPSDAQLLPKELLTMGLAQAEETVQSALQALHTHMAALGETSKAGVVSEAALVFTTAARRLATLAKDPA